MDKLTQLREMRERNAKAGRVRSLVNPRTLPSAEAIKAAADRAETKAAEKRMLAAGGAYRPAQHIATHIFSGPELLPAVVSVTPVSATQRKTTKMSESAAASDFDKGLYQKLYLRVRRARTPEIRTEAEAALRKEFPNQRPRAQKKPEIAKPKSVKPRKAKAAARKKKKK